MYGWLSLDARFGTRAFASAECGLCAHFGARFRTRTRWLAGTDPTLLVMLLDALVEEGPEVVRVRCPLTLMLTRRRALDPAWEPLECVAELQLVLAGEKLLDDRVDRDGWLSRVASGLLDGDIIAAAASLEARGFPLEALRATLRSQGGIERDARASLDALAQPTARGLGLIAGWLGARVGADAEVLERFGETLGRLLYVVDALHDLQRDRARGRFNPLDHVLGYLSPRRLAWLEARVEAMARAHREAFEALTLVRHREVLEASLVDGLVDKAREGIAAVGSLSLPLLAT